MFIVKKLFIACALLTSMTVPAIAGVNIYSPSNSSYVSSPFTLSADASTCSSQTVSAMGYSLDNSTDTAIVNGTSVTASVGSGTGTHTVHVKAWGEKGSSCVTDVTVTVTASNSVVPSNAASVGNVQALGDWKASNDSAAGGSASGWMAIVNSPARTGSARKFVTSFSDNGDERYQASFGDDTSSTNFVYDTWLYIPSSSTNIANLEMDMNQVMSNGQTVIFGFQCDGWNGTWDYTANTGTAKKPIDTWVRSRQGCNPQSWSKNTWHHVQIKYSRNDSGFVTYESVWLDGREQAINATVSSVFSLGWSPVLLTNFQVDGRGWGTNTVYMDDLIVSRW